MALTITQEPDFITPVYSPVIIKAKNPTSAVSSYEINITINGETISIKKLPDSDGNIELDISSDLQPYFESEVQYITVAEVETLNNGILSYSVEVIANLIAGGTESDISSTLYTFNGTVPPGQTFNIADFIMSDSNEGRFLNSLVENREIDADKTITLSLFWGEFDTFDSTLDDLVYKLYDKSNTPLYSNILALGSPSSTPSIRSFKVDVPAAYQDSADRIELYSLTGKCEPLTIKVNQPNVKHQTYQIAWVNALGVTEHYFFRGNSENIIEVDKEEYKSISNYTNFSKNYNIEVEDIIVCYSDYICSDVALGLKSLWYSPKVVSIENGQIRDIIIDVDNIKIFNRIPSELPFYKLEFKYAEEFKIQQR